MTNQDPTMIPNPDFNPFFQPVTFLLPDGVTPFNVTLDQITWFNNQAIRLSIQQGVETGASILVLFTLLLLSPPGKRRTSMFILNLLALIANSIRMVLKCVYDGSAWLNIYFQLVGDARYIRLIDYSNSIATVVFSFITFCFVLASLLVQVRVVVATAGRKTRRALMFVVGSLTLAATALQFAGMVVNSQIIVNITSPQTSDFTMLLKAITIVTIVNLCCFTAIFLAKLAVVMSRRRKLGQHQFGPMQVLFICGIQSMLIPCKYSFLFSFHHQLTVPSPDLPPQRRHRPRLHV
jgi:pheromone alpha factor receptor